MLIIPSVSIGNVPQLAVDLLIYTFNFKFVRDLDDSTLCPFLGPADHVKDQPGADSLTTAAQLYRLGDDYLVQLRSPPLSGHKEEFVQSLIYQIPEASSHQVLILGSANAGTNESLEGNCRIEELDTASLLPDSGYFSQALTAFPHASGLLIWVYEGDNFDDSIRLAKACSEKLGMPTPASFRTPISWSRVYGNDIPLGIEKGLYT